MLLTSKILSVYGQGPGISVPRYIGLFDAHMQILFNRENSFSPCTGYQHLYESSKQDILIYIHDDVQIHDPLWYAKVMWDFESNPKLGVLGFGGAVALGHPDLYKLPYRIERMARSGYYSNQSDWQVHGEHCDRYKRVAVVDAFFMAIRRDLLHLAGGWPVEHLTHHCLDLWICCEARRHEMEVAMRGIPCTHLGGGTSTTWKYCNASWLQGGNIQMDHSEPHKWIYANYGDVLPIDVRHRIG